MKTHYLLTSAIIASSLFIAGCDDDDDDPIQPPQLRVTHASPDAPAVNVYVDGELLFRNVDYKDSTGLLPVTAGTRSIEVRGINPDGSELSVIGPVNITNNARERLDIIAYDNVLAGSNINIKAKLITQDIVPVSQVAVSVLHAAPMVADVDIYVTGANDALNSVTPIDAGFGDNAGPVTLMADTSYRIRITPDASNTVVYDSGPVSFSAGTDLLLAAVENTTGIGDNPVNLLAIDGLGASEVFDESNGAEVRVVHNSADTPDVDVFVGGAEVLSNVPFTGSSNYEDVAAPAGIYSVVVSDAATNTVEAIQANADLENGTSYSIIAIGGLNNVTDETVEGLLTVDDRRTVATEARLRVVHGSYAVAENIPVDVYLTATADISQASPVITNLAYGEFTDQLAVAEGNYYVTVTAAGDKSTVALATGPLALANNNNYTVIARDPGTGETGSPLILANILNE